MLFLRFFKDQGFSNTHIAKIVRSLPNVLVYNPEKTLLPKIEFFRSLWVSRTDLAKNLSSNHHLLAHSLENYILPIFNCFKSVFGTDTRISNPHMWCDVFYYKSPIQNVTSNIAMLRELGVPEKCIKMSLAHFSTTMLQNNDDFAEALSQVKEMGFNPSKSVFMMALVARSGKSSRSRWDRSYEIFRSSGWSEDEIHMAYRMNPFCMLMSEQKLTTLMDFMMNKMGWSSWVIAKSACVLVLSLKKSIIPRGSVIQLLWSKGFITKDISLYSIFTSKEKSFLQNFVIPFEEQVPELRDIYQGKIGIREL